MGWVYVCAKWEVWAVARHEPSQSSFTSEQQEKSAAPTSVGALNFTLALFLYNCLLTLIHLLLLVEETGYVSWYQTFTSWCSDQTLLFSLQLIRKSIKIKSLCESGDSWKKFSSKCTSHALTPGINSTLCDCVYSCVNKQHFPILYKWESCEKALRQCVTQKEWPLFAVLDKWCYHR